MNSDPAASTVAYHPEAEESARLGWYLANRDAFVYRIASESLSTSDRVLDVGCGSGGLLQKFEARGITAIGVDRDWKSLTWGKACGRARALLQSDAGRLPFRDRTFDLCVSSEMLEHVEDDRQALAELLRVSRGRVVFTVPAHMFLWTDSDRILMHHRRYSRSDVVRLVEAAGGRLLRLHPYGVLPMLGILGYRLAVRQSQSDALPLASRYATPAWMDRLLGMMFSSELSLSRQGFVPCGHAWWAVVERR